MFMHALLAVAVFVVAGIVLSLVGVPYAWGIAAVLGILFFVFGAGSRRRGART